MILSLGKNKTFTLTIPSSNGKKFPFSVKGFEKKEDGHFTTDSFYTAFRFLKYADKKTKDFFHKFFIKKYSLSYDLPDYLDEHQKEGVKWILSRNKCYLAHAPGAGKTCQAITAFLLYRMCLKEFSRALCIVPPSLVENWIREAKIWSEKLNIKTSVTPSHLVGSFESLERDDDFLIFPDSFLNHPNVREKLQKIDFSFLIIDEASRFKESLSQRTISLFGGSFLNSIKEKIVTKSLIKKADHVVLMDGSPMPNRPMELWAPLYAVTPATIGFMNKDTFGFRYCDPQINRDGTYEFKGATYQDELREKITKSFMHVVAEDRLNHPERLRKMIFLPFNQIKNDMPEIKEWNKKNISLLKGIEKSSSYLNEEREKENLSRMRRKLGLTKIKFAKNYIREKIEKGESVLFFCWHREVLETLGEELNCPIILGGTPPKDREKYLKNFQEGKTKCLGGNIITMGRGHNIQRAQRNIFVEYSWNDETNIQCEKRASRRGSIYAKIPCDYLVVPESLDEIVLKQCFKKAENVRKIITHKKSLHSVSIK